MCSFWKLAAAGFTATAITYGPARMGFGLFLPEFKTVFSLSSGTAGLISGLGFLGMLFGLISAYGATAASGPRLPVLMGLFSATLGMGMIAAATSLPVLATGVFLAMTSAGFAWAPFNNAVHRQVQDGARPAALSIISTGTSLGIAAAGATAFAVGGSDLSWRVAWAAFAIASAMAFIGNFGALRDVAGSPGPVSILPWAVLLRRSAMPLYAISLSFGVTTAIYISFAADRIKQSGGLPQLQPDMSPAIMFVSFGLFGLVGLTTGRCVELAGLPRLLRLLMLASALSLVLVALAPTSWTGVLLSACFQGGFVMMMSAILALWSERLFPNLPSLSFTTALVAVTGGSVLGPVGAGFISDSFGAAPMFVATATISLVTALAIQPRHIQDRKITG